MAHFAGSPIDRFARPLAQGPQHPTGAQVGPEHEPHEAYRRKDPAVRSSSPPPEAKRKRVRSLRA
jgi:hypothetical protein